MSLTTPTRRSFIKGATATAATLLAARALFPGGAMAEGPAPEVTGTKLGFIALTDSAPLIIAKEKGLFAKYGVPDMAIEKQASWGATRDNSSPPPPRPRRTARPRRQLSLSQAEPMICGCATGWRPGASFPAAM